MSDDTLIVLIIFGGIFAIFFLPSTLWMIEKIVKAKRKDKEQKKKPDKASH